MSKLSLAHICSEDPEILNDLKSKIEANAEPIDEIIDEIISKCCQELDDYIKYVKQVMHDNSTAIPTAILEDITIVLPVLLYQVSDSQERLGIKEDIAKSTKAEIYNTTYNSVSGTVNDKSAKAELECQSETVLHIIYQRSYKKLKARMDLGLELLQSVKKVLSKRITEMELTRSSKI